MEHAGVAGVHIEDSKNPKHLLRLSDDGTMERLHDDDVLAPISEMCLRIDAAVNARRDGDFVIIARTDEIMNGGRVDRTIARGIAYAEAGADLFMPLLMTPAQAEEIGAAVPIPLLDVNRPTDAYRHTPLKVDIFTGFATSAALAAYKALMTHLRDIGDYPADIPRLPWAEYDELLDDAAWIAEAERWRNRNDG
jgi:2-methylisocitrate lyase-like PEP mutase family enzyme